MSTSTGPGRAGARDVEGLADGGGNLVHIAHHVIVLGDGQGDAGDVVSWKASLPMSFEFTWPVMHTMGTESSIAWRCR